MKLLQLDIENYGIYTNHRFDFGDGGFRLIYGPNEAGKTTLLHLVRELFFGFAHQNPYVLSSHTGKLAATATLEMRDGARIQFRRQKGRTGTIVGEVEETGAAVDDDNFAQLLGGAGDELYRHIFGFSLAELSAGEKSLQHANLNEALYGSGLGGLANFQRVQQVLQDEHDALFSPKARGKTRTINRLLSAIKEQKSLLRKLADKPKDYEQLRASCAGHEAEAEQLRENIEKLQQQSRRWERLETALGKWLQLSAAKEELDQLETPDTFPKHGAEEFQRTKLQLLEATQECTRLQVERDDTLSKRNGIRPAPEIVAVEAVIRGLHQDVGRMQRFEADVPLRLQEAETIKMQVQSRIVAINPQWSLEQIDQFQTSLAQRESVQRMAREYNELKRRETALTSQRPELQRQFSDSSHQFEELGRVELCPALEDLSERAAAYRVNCEKQAETAREIDEIADEHQLLTQKLGAPLKHTIDDFESLPVPLVATVSEFRDREDGCRQALVRAQEHLDETNTELAEQREQLAELDSRQSVPSRAELIRRREQRDDTWRVIRRKYIEGSEADEDLAAPLGAEGQSLLPQFENEVSAADELADDRQVKAELVARREQLAASVERSRTRLRDVEQACQRRKVELADTERDWIELWNDCHFEPLSPAAMLDWLRVHGGLLEKRQQRRLQESRGKRLQQEIARFESELAEAFPDSAGTVEELLGEARLRSRLARETATQRKQLESQLPQQQQKLRDLDVELSEIQRELQDWQSGWQAMLQEFGFADRWDVQLATKILTELGEVRQEYRKACTLDERVADMQSETAEFEAAVAELCESLSAGVAGLSATDAVLELSRRLDRAKQAELEQQQLADEMSRIERLTAAARAQQKQHQTKWDELLTAAGARSEAEFFRTADTVQRRTELENEIRPLTRDIKIISAAENEQRFLTELQQADADSIAGERRRLAEAIAEAQRAYQRAVEKAGISRDKLDAMDTESTAAQLASDLESSRSELCTAVDRWAPLVLTRALMAHAIRKFEREHQPQMLRDVSQLFSKMTLGRYVGIDRKLDEKGTLLIRQHDGEPKEPASLSTGTREQLYLAIRLAFVKQYCRDSEPLPLVMDDVLVNFDESRAKHTLDVLLEVAEEIQILFLTCHRHVAELILESLPNLEPIVLSTDHPGGDPMTAAGLTDAAASPGVEDERSNTKRRRHKPRSNTQVQPVLFPRS